MNFYSKLCLGQSPRQPPPLKDAVTKANVPWVNDRMDYSLSNVIPNMDRRTQLLSLLGPAGCTFCLHLLLDQGEGKLLFPHLQWSKSSPITHARENLPQNQSITVPHLNYCPMVYHLTLAGRRKLISQIKRICQTCLRTGNFCACQKKATVSMFQMSSAHYVM